LRFRKPPGLAIMRTMALSFGGSAGGWTSVASRAVTVTSGKVRSGRAGALRVRRATWFWCVNS
jgi:hypothetical protein